MNFQKEDLRSSHYYWKEEDKQLFTGSPASRLFDPSNGEQVLFLINAYAESMHKFSKEDGWHIETILVKELPLVAKSEITVLNWIKENISMANKV